MSKGKASFGKKNKKTHKVCRRCGNHSMHVTTGVCASCGFGRSSKRKSYSWQTKRGKPTQRVRAI